MDHANAIDEAERGGAILGVRKFCAGGNSRQGRYCRGNESKRSV